MKLLRRLLGLDFPDPEVGQVWRSRHSGRAIRVTDVRTSDCGKLWHIGVQHETEGAKFNPVGMAYCMFPTQWRRMLREEGRTLVGPGHVPPRPLPAPAPARTARIPGALTTEAVADRARAAGFTLESWATNPPKPAMWHGTPEAMRKLLAPDGVPKHWTEDPAEVAKLSGWVHKCPMAASAFTQLPVGQRCVICGATDGLMGRDALGVRGTSGGESNG